MGRSGLSAFRPATSMLAYHQLCSQQRHLVDTCVRARLAAVGQCLTMYREVRVITPKGISLIRPPRISYQIGPLETFRELLIRSLGREGLPVDCIDVQLPERLTVDEQTQEVMEHRGMDTVITDIIGLYNKGQLVGPETVTFIVEPVRDLAEAVDNMRIMDGWPAGERGTVVAWGSIAEPHPARTRNEMGIALLEAIRAAKPDGTPANTPEPPQNDLEQEPQVHRPTTQPLNSKSTAGLPVHSG